MFFKLLGHKPIEGQELNIVGHNYEMQLLQIKMQILQIVRVLCVHLLRQGLYFYMQNVVLVVKKNLRSTALLPLSFLLYKKVFFYDPDKQIRNRKNSPQPHNSLAKSHSYREHFQKKSVF